MDNVFAMHTAAVNSPSYGKRHVHKPSYLVGVGLRQGALL